MLEIFVDLLFRKMNLPHVNLFYLSAHRMYETVMMTCCIEFLLSALQLSDVARNLVFFED